LTVLKINNMKPKVTTEHHKGQAQIFDNPFLESLTKSNVKSNAVVYGLTVAIVIYVALYIIDLSFLTFISLFTFALFSWTFAEYVLHRYLFHWMSENKYAKRFHFIMHGNHHLYPKDIERILMPPVPGLIMGSILFGVFYIFFNIIGFPDLTWAFFPGFFLGYLLYSFFHYATHTVRPPDRFKNIWNHHLLHHYKYPEKAFGVSSTIWDRVFRTMPPKQNHKAK